VTTGTRRPRDFAMTDVRLEARALRVLTGKSGRSYLVYERIAAASGCPSDGDADLSQAARRLADIALCTLCAGGYLTAIWYTFLRG
jgi:hypothetical protein